MAKNGKTKLKKKTGFLDTVMEDIHGEGDMDRAKQNRARRARIKRNKVKSYER